MHSSPTLRHLRFFAVVVALAAAVFSRASTSAGAPTPVLLISMDGFRWDYTERYPEQTAHIRQLAREGVAAKGLIPVFPSNTFPNHYALVTGLYPSHSGIINNRMFDAQLNAAFVSSQSASSRDSRWWGGEPR
jgi:alkaline phosphatase D